MNLEPLLTAPLAVQLHVLTVLPSVVLGAWLLFASQKGSTLHRFVGKVYLTLMTTTAVAAVFIRAFGWGVEVGSLRFGLLHLFVPLTVWSVWTALTSVKAGRLGDHQGAMKGLFFGGLVFAGLLAFTPGRIMHRVFFE